MRDDDTDIEALPASVSFRFVRFVFFRYSTDCKYIFMHAYCLWLQIQDCSGLPLKNCKYNCATLRLVFKFLGETIFSVLYVLLCRTYVHWVLIYFSFFLQVLSIRATRFNSLFKLTDGRTNATAAALSLEYGQMWNWREASEETMICICWKAVPIYFQVQ